MSPHARASAFRSKAQVICERQNLCPLGFCRITNRQNGGATQDPLVSAMDEVLAGISFRAQWAKPWQLRKTKTRNGA